MKSIKMLETEQIKENIPYFKPGDTIKVHVKIIEGDKERLQAFEGVCIARGNRGIRENFTLRRISHGIGVERTLLINSPRLEKIEILRHGKVRSAKLYYLRDKVGKAAKIKELKKA